jgi:hypothetical protein
MQSARRLTISGLPDKATRMYFSAFLRRCNRFGNLSNRSSVLGDARQRRQRSRRNEGAVVSVVLRVLRISSPDPIRINLLPNLLCCTRQIATLHPVHCSMRTGARCREEETKTSMPVEKRRELSPEDTYPRPPRCKRPYSVPSAYRQE